MDTISDANPEDVERIRPLLRSGPVPTWKLSQMTGLGAERVRNACLVLGAVRTPFGWRL